MEREIAATTGVTFAQVIAAEREACRKQAEEIHLYFSDERERLQKRNGGYARYWLRVSFAKETGAMIAWDRYQVTAGTESGKARPFAVKIGKDGGYSMHSFRDAEDWERRLIERVEQSVAPIRRRLKRLGEIGRMTYQYENKLGRQQDQPAIDLAMLQQE